MGVFHLLVDFFYSDFLLAQIFEDGFDGVWLAVLGVDEGGEEAAELAFDSHEFVQALFEDVGEVEQLESVSRGGGVEDDEVELESLDGFDQLGERHGLVDPRHRRHQLRQKRLGLRVHLLSVERRHLHALLLHLRVHLHRPQSLYALDRSRLAVHFLIEAVTQIVSRVR